MPDVARLGKAISGYDGQGSQAPGSRADTFRRRVVDLRTTRTIRSAIEIRAPLETVWRVLSDFPSYRDWNPHLREVRGRPRQGGRLMVLSQPPGARALALRPRLLIWRPPYEFRWRATFISRHLFSGEHGFRLETHSEDRVRFVHDETFRGLLVPLYSLVRMSATRRGFAQMNEALRDRAESIAAAQTTPADDSPAEGPAPDTASAESSAGAAEATAVEPLATLSRSLLRRMSYRRRNGGRPTAAEASSELVQLEVETPAL